MDPPAFEQAYVDGILMRPTVAVAQLSINPRSFLGRYPLFVQDDGTLGASAVTDRVFVTNWMGGSKDSRQQRPGRILGTLRMHDTEGFCFNMTGLGMPNGHQIRVHRVATVQSNLAPSWCPLPTNGPSLMATCMLTGCSFIVRQGVNSIECGHLLPTNLATQTAIETGSALHTRLLGQGYLAVYGRLRYSHKGADDRKVSIVGVRRNGAWKIYAQKLDFTNSIRSLHRIYPPERGDAR